MAPAHRTAPTPPRTAQPPPHRITPTHRTAHAPHGPIARGARVRWGSSVTSRVAGPCASSRAPRARPPGGTRDMRPRGPSPGRRDLALPADVHGPSPTHSTRTDPPHARPRTGDRRGRRRGRAEGARPRTACGGRRRTSGPPALRSPCGPAPHPSRAVLRPCPAGASVWAPAQTLHPRTGTPQRPGPEPLYGHPGPCCRELPPSPVTVPPRHGPKEPRCPQHHRTASPPCTSRAST